MQTQKTYAFLESRPGSIYRQPFIRGTRLRVEIPFAYTVTKQDEEGEEPGLTPEKVACFLGVSVDAVLEAVDWCRSHWNVVQADHAREERLARAHGMDHPEYKMNPRLFYKPLAPEERARIVHDETISG